MEYTSQAIENEKSLNEIPAGTQGTVAHVKTFGTAVRIAGQREISKIRSDMQEVRRESLSSDNWSSVEQQFQTIEMSIKSTVSRSVAIPSATEIYGEVEVNVGGGINIPFVAEAKADIKTKAGIKHSWGKTITNEVTEEVTTTVSRQTVKVGPKKRIDMTWIFYSVEDTIEYLIDLELDVDNTYVGSLEMVLHRNDEGFVSPVSFKRVRLCALLRDLSMIPESAFKTFGIAIENGKHILKDFPIEVKVKSYHGHFQTEEEDLV